MTWKYNDGGREEARRKGKCGDCVCRAITIATGKPYEEVYDALNSIRDSMRQTKKIKKSAARNGVARPIYKRYLESLGWKFVPTMSIGSGCKIHLRAEELPSGRIICRVSGHVVAVIDGVINDTYDCSRDGTRCVYGYYQF